MVKTKNIETIRIQAPKTVMLGNGEGSTTKWKWA